VAGVPETTVVGSIVRLVKAGALIVNETPIEELPRVPLIVAMVLTATGVVVTGNVALVAPAAMVTGLVTFAAMLLEETVTASPPAGAALEIVIVPVELTPPIRVLGDSVTVFKVGAVTVSVADFFDMPALAEIVAVAFLATATVLTVKVAVVALAATFALVETVAEELFEAKVTTTPLAGAAAESVIVPFELLPPATLAGDRVILAIDWPKERTPRPNSVTNVAKRNKCIRTMEGLSPKAPSFAIGRKPHE